MLSGKVEYMERTERNILMELPLEYAGQEKRKSPRMFLRLAVIYQVDQPLIVRMEVGDKEVLATTLDLGEGGMALSTNFDIPLMTILSIKFSLLKPDTDGAVRCYGPMEITGEVRSNVFLDKLKRRRRLGICFTRISEKDKAEINNFMKVAFKKS